MTAQEAYILAKAYTKKSIEGAGSLKGAACQIKSIEAITGGHRITFEWEDNDGEVSTDTMDVMDGEDGNDGVGISSITYKETDAHGNYVYTVTLTDTNTYDIICPKGAQGETGATGATGNGIASIVKTSTAGLVDTYTITYTNGQTTTFTVTNGESITVDSAMSGSSTNPVQNKVITEALADKQDAEDNNLTTEAKTIVGAINEHEGDVSSLKSGFTALDNEVNGSATTYPYADVITVEDAVPANLAECSVKIEPVQDLHGQSAPYVGGAGKNLLPMTVDGIKALNTAGTWSGNTYTLNGVSFTVQTDNGGNVTGIKTNGTATSDITFAIHGYQKLSDYGLTNEMYIMSCVNAKSSAYLMCALYGTGREFRDTTGNGYTFTPTNEELDSNYRFIILISNNAILDNFVFYPMVEKGSTRTTFAPYTNICPISGHTEAVVTVTAPNMYVDGTAQIKVAASWTTDNTESAQIATDLTVTGNIVTGTPSNYRWLHIPFKFVGGKTLYLKLSDASITGNKLRISSSLGAVVGYFNNYQYTPSEDFDGFVDIGINPVSTNLKFGIGLTADFNTDNYNKKSPYYTLALGDTIYGGTVDFDSGVMTVDRVKLTKNTSTMNNDSPDYPGWKGAGIEQYVGNNVTGTPLTNTNVGFGYGYETRYNADIVDLPLDLYGKTQDEWKALAIDVEFIVELATPTTVQLTPEQIQLLQGTNTLYASTGQISVTVNGVSGAIGSVQTQANATDAALAELAADIAEQLPDAPTTDGTYVLTVTVADGTPTYSWESAT